MSVENLRAMSDEQLVHWELQLERKLVDANFRLGTQQLDDTSTLGKLRRDIARVRTVERERERAQKLGPNALRDKHRGTFVPGKAEEAAAGASKGFLSGLADKIAPKA